MKNTSKMKLIRTNLLLKTNLNTAAAVATASHIDFCKYKFRNLKSDIGSLFKEFIESFVMFSCLSATMLFTPLIMLTNGLVLYPIWIIVHVVKTKKIVKHYGVEDLNKSAEKLLEEANEEE